MNKRGEKHAPMTRGMVVLQPERGAVVLSEEVFTLFSVLDEASDIFIDCIEGRESYSAEDLGYLTQAINQALLRTAALSESYKVQKLALQKRARLLLDNIAAIQGKIGPQEIRSN